ncbi:MAG: proton-conducting transporter membrane subunit [Desulfobacteraceae bacterium]
MTSNLPALVIVVPLFASLVAAAAGWIDRRFPYPVAVVSLAASFLTAVGLLVQVLRTGLALEYRMAGWAAPMGIVYVIDHLSAIVLVAITGVSLINLVFNQDLIRAEFRGMEGAFNSLYVLFTAGLIGMTATGDAFNLYVLLEIVSLSGYALIGLGSNRAPLATLNYLFIGTIGATFYLLGVGYLYIATGSLNMVDIASMMPNLMGSSVVLIGFVICLSGLFVKMALFPVHGWLPGAYSESTSIAAGLIAPLTTKVTIYVMIRICLAVFTAEYVFDYLNSGRFIVWLAIATMLFGAFSALAQKNYRKMFSYIIISEVGYMVGGFFLGNKLGVTGAMLHIINDAVMTLAVFMAAGIFLWKTGGENRNDLKGLFASMPFTMAGFVIGGLSIIGVPPTCGFFSKWYLVSGGIAAGNYYFVAALIICSLVNAVLFFRLFEISFFEPFKDHHHDNKGSEDLNAFSSVREAPLVMLIPFLMVSGMLLVLGVYSGTIVTNILQFAIPTGII